MDFSAWGAIFAHWPTDWIIIGAFAIFAALDAMRSGSARIAALVLSLPAGLLFTQALPQALLLGPLSAQLTAPLAQVGVVVVIEIVLYIVAHRLIFTFSDGAKPIQALVAGLAAGFVGFVVWVPAPRPR